MIIDLNILKRLGKRFGVMPISKVPDLQQLFQNSQIFIKAPAGLEPAFTGGGYQWDDEINGYRLGNNQKLFLLPNGTTVWTFKDVLARGLGLDSVQKWTSGDAEYPMGKANAFFIVYGKLTGQDLGEGETAGDNVSDGETDAGDEGGGLAMAEPESTPFSKQDIQAMLKGDFGSVGATPKQSMDTSIPSGPPAPPPDRSKVGQPLPPEAGSEAEKIIKTLYKQAKINPSSKLSKQNPIRLDSDAIIDLYQRAKKMAPEEGEKLIAFLKSGAVLPLEEGHIAKYQLEHLMEYIVGGIVGEVEKAKKKAKAKKKQSFFEPSQTHWEPPEHSQMDWDAGGEKGNIPGRGSEQQWLEDLANKLWKDSEDIGHSHQGWKVKRVVPHEDGTKSYLLTLTKQYHKSRIFVNRNGRWFWTDPIDRHNGWQEVEGPVTEPSIEQEETLDEMTTTSGGGGSSAGTPGYNIPGAFGRKMSRRKEHIEVLGYKMTPEGEKEYKRPADKLYEAIKSQVKKLMGEDLVPKPVGKCPHCGKDIWSKDAMVCSSCKAQLPPKTEPKPGTGGINLGPLQQEDSGLGADFDRAQRAYDNQMPKEEPEIECPECGGTGFIKDKGHRGRAYWWSAECQDCGHQWGDDNFDDDRDER